MTTALLRAFLGFVAGAIAVLTFHQGMVAVLHLLGFTPFAAFRIVSIPPFGVPLVVSLSFWGGLYGAAFGALMPRFTLPLWLCGVILGLVATLVGMFIVAPIKGHPIAQGWMAGPILRSLLINGTWGLGVGLILPLLLPRRLNRAGLRVTGANPAT